MSNNVVASHSETQGIELTKTSQSSSLLFLDQLDVDVSGIIVVMIGRMWDVSAITGRYLSTDFVVSDSKGNIIHCSAKGTVAHNFLRLKEGGIYSIKNFTVHPNKGDFRIVKHASFMLEFDGATATRKATVSDIGFIRYPFQLVDFDRIEATNNKYFIGTKGHTMGRTGRCSDREEDKTCWMCAVVLTSMSVQNYNNKLYLSSSSSTTIYDDESIPTLQELETQGRHDGRVQSYCGLSVRDIDVLCSGPNPAIFPLSDRNTINVDQTAGPSTSRYASTRLRRRSAGPVHLRTFKKPPKKSSFDICRVVDVRSTSVIPSPFVAQLLGLSLSSSVIPIWNTDILPRLSMLCLLLFLVQSWVAICRGVARDCAWIVFLAKLWSSFSLPPYYAPCKAIDVWSLWALPSVGPGPVAYCMVWARGSDGAIRHHVLPVWLSFSKRDGVDDPCCYSKKFDSLKNWNNHFFWIDASVCPLSISWFSGVSVVKDPLLVDEVVDLPCVELLNENRTIIRKYPEVFLCLVGLSHSFTETDVRPTLLHNNDEEMGLLDLVNSVDPFKVKIGERTLAKNEKYCSYSSSVTLLRDELEEEDGGRICFLGGNNSLGTKKYRGSNSSDGGNTRDEVKIAGGVIGSGGGIGGSLAVALYACIYGSLCKGGMASEDKRYLDKFKKSPKTPSKLLQKQPNFARVIGNMFTSAKSPTALRRLIRQSGQADTGSGTTAPVIEDATSSSVTPTLERAPGDDFHDNVVLLVSLAQAGVNVHVTEPASDARDSSAPELEARALSATPSQGSSADDFYESQTINSATALNVLEKSEDGAVEVVELLKRVSDLEVVVVVKASEVATLNTQNASLLEKVSALEVVRGELDSKDEVKRRFSERAAKLDARTADVIRDMDDDLSPHMLTAIVGRRWVVGHSFCFAVHKCACSVECRSALGKVILMAINKSIQQGLEARVVHGKAGRSLTQIAAYDSKIEGKYVAAVSEFEYVSFPLLDELEGLKDSSLALIMYALALKDDHGNTDPTPKFHQFQPSLDHVTVLIYFESGSIDREMLLSETIPAYTRLQVLL
ncbi:putative gypsy type transposase [Tanacetum coccineum]